VGSAVTTTILSILALAGTAFGVVWTVRAQRRLVAASAQAQAAAARKTEAEAEQIDDERIERFRAALDEEYARRRDVERIKEELERKVTAQGARITALEAQVIALGAVPVNGH